MGGWTGSLAILKRDPRDETAQASLRAKGTADAKALRQEKAIPAPWKN